MPFDFKKYDAKCEAMSVDELHLEWQHYTRLISGASTSTAVSGIAVPFTLGVSTIGVAVAAPAIHNARKKRAIIEKHFQKLGTTHNTRKRDVLGPMAVSSTIGVVTLGVGAVGADVIGHAGVEHGIGMIVENEMAVKASTHLAVELAVVGAEEHHAKDKKAAEAYKHMQRPDSNKPSESGYGQQQDYGAQIQPPASYGAPTQYQAQEPEKYGDPLEPPPAYTPNDFISGSMATSLNNKSQSYTFQPQYLPPQQETASPYMPQSPNLTHPQYLPMAQDFKPPVSPAPTYASMPAIQQGQNASNAPPTPAATPGPGQPQQPQYQQQYAPLALTNQPPGQPQYFHGQYLPQPPQPSQQNMQQYQQHYPQQHYPPQTFQIQYTQIAPSYSGQQNSQPTMQPSNSTSSPYPQQQKYFPPPPSTPQPSSQSLSQPPPQSQPNYETVQPPASYASTPTPTPGSYSAQQTQMNYGYPTPAPTPCGQNAENSYFNQPHHA